MIKLIADVAQRIVAHAGVEGWNTNVYYNDELYVERWNGQIAERLAQIRNSIGGQAQFARSREKLIEITGSGVHKGKALLWLAKFLGFAQKEVLAIGDSDNDRTMLKMAGLGVAMGNAPPEVKHAADCETLSNVEHGVAYAINRHVLGQS